MAANIPPLVKIQSPTAAGVCQEYKPHPEAKALLHPSQTPAEYLQKLKENHHSEESIKFLAHGMPDRESTWWATQSARKVANPANVADHEAIKAADAWVKNPTPATQQAAAAAAAKTDYQTPGAWAAQAAAWSKPPAPAVGAGPVPSIAAPAIPAAPGLPAVLAAPAMPRLAPHAASGAVMLAAAMSVKPLPAVPKIEPPKMPVLEKPTLATPTMQIPKPPEPPPLTPKQRVEVAKIHEPFVNMGMDVAQGKNSWS